MNQRKSRKFSFRSFVSYATLFSFLIMAFSGVLLYACPVRTASGQVCVLNLTIANWAELHISMSLLFVFFGFIHIWLNIRPLIAYLKDRATNRPAIKLDVAAAVLIIALFAIGTVAGIPPFSSMVELSFKIRSSFTGNSTPIGTPLVSQQPSNGIPTVSQVSLSPMVSGTVITETPEPQPTKNKYEEPVICKGGEGCGRTLGTGKLTLREFCEINGFDLQTALDKLKKDGVEATPESHMRHIADELGIFPYDMNTYLNE